MRREGSKMLSVPGPAVITRPGWRARETGVRGNEIMSGVSSYSLDYCAVQCCDISNV